MASRKRFRFLLFVAVGVSLLALGAGCVFAPWGIQTDHLGPITEIELRDETGGRVSEWEVSADSPEAVAVRDWLRTHPNGWRFSLVSYVPSKRVKGQDFDLNVSGRRCVLNYRQTNGRWVQVERPLADGEEFPDVFGER